MNIILRFLDLGVSLGLFLVMLWQFKKLCHLNKLTRTGAQLCIPVFAALTINVVSRILEGVDDTVRSGYVFAVLSRVGMLLVFLGWAAFPKQAERQDGKKPETKEDWVQHQETPPEGTTLLVATAVPLEAVL